MNDPTLACRDEKRRETVRDEHRNGLDYLEVSDDQRTLYVYFIGNAPEKTNEEEKIKKENVRIEGGRRIRGIEVVGDPQVHRIHGSDDWMEVRVDKPGDFSAYTLRLVEAKDGRPTDKTMSEFDPCYAQLEFSFKAGCPSDLDCKTQEVCPPPEHDEPEINYLAKDYASFRQLILDRLALVMPEWQERHVPDLAIALVEVLAYVGDHLSYYQDAVATEAYLETARRRISVRRHARLVDYQMHEGCNARAWIYVKTEEDESLDPNDIYFITGFGDPLKSSRVLAHADLQKVPSGRYEVFEPLVEERVLLRPDDLKDPAGLASKLNAESNEQPGRSASSDLSRYLWDRFSPETRQRLEEYSEADPRLEELRLAVTNELNWLLENDDLYGERRPQQGLAGETNKQAECGPSGKKVLARLNRYLLEEAYPDEIAKSREIHLYEAHNEIRFYTWGDQECCLPRGATTATLRDKWVPEPGGKPSDYEPDEQVVQQAQQQQYKPSKEEPPAPQGSLHLQEGDVLIFEEVKGPRTGEEADRDPAHRHAVRLTRVEPGEDPLVKQRVGSRDLPTPIVEIEWAPEDALPFPLCLSAIGAECEFVEDISVARGNVILADHGRTLEREGLGIVLEGKKITQCGDECHAAETVVKPRRFRPHLEESPLTFSQPLPTNGPASDLLKQDPHQARPQIKELISTQDASNEAHALWMPRLDLLGSQSQDRHFVVEIDNEGRAYLRFGNGELGRIPEAGTTFHATYRVGNGPSGNVGAETITHVVYRREQVSGLEPCNLLPAQGGTSPEPLARAKLLAPHAFRTESQRAITADDYARLAERHPKVQRAAATLRWTGSWYEALVAIDPRGDTELQNVFTATAAAFVEAVRQAVERRLDLGEFGIPPDEEMPDLVIGILQDLRAAVERNMLPGQLLALVNEKLSQLGDVERDHGRLRRWVEGLVAELKYAVSLLHVRDLGLPSDDRLLDEIEKYLHSYRRIGHDLRVIGAHYIPLDVAMEVCVRPDFLRGHIKAALLDVFSNRVLPDGRRGFFHPDNLSFGDGIYLSKLVAEAQAVTGVESARVTKLERLFEGSNHEIENGVLSLGSWEIARLDNDPSFPENGVLRLEIGGGR